jgi:hypothetical protein
VYNKHKKYKMTIVQPNGGISAQEEIEENTAMIICKVRE